MKYVILCLAMLCSFALGSRGHSTAAPAPAPAYEEMVAPDTGDEGAEATCGGNTCGKGTYCCNASCGICVPKGMSCTQQAC